MDILLIIFYFLFPLLIIYLVNRFSFFDKVGAVVWAYIIGLIIGNINIIPQNFAETQDLLTTITIPLALPMLLFSLNVKSWIKLAGKTFISLIISIISVIIIIITGFYIFKGDYKDIWKVAGMMVGVYSGGTPNLAALKTALFVDSNTYIAVHTFDMFYSSIYLLFLMTFGKKFFEIFLIKYKPKKENNIEIKNDKLFVSFFEKKYFKQYIVSILISIMIFALGGALSLIVPKDYSMAVAILSITSLAIIASLISYVRKLNKSFDFGMYLILVFSLVVASMADFTKFTIESLNLFYYIGFAIFGSLILQIIFAKIFKVDADTTIITSTALICSPPFVPVIAQSLRNKEIILSGITVGVIGYAIGNYFGVFVAYFLR